MSTKCHEENLAIDCHSREEEEEEEESLSLSDLPINQIENHEAASTKEAQEDFNFNFNCGGICSLADSQMCAADDVFSKGKILPFRHSVSSETGLSMFRPDIPPFISRSQSMDQRHTISGFSSGSTTRSSSIRSSLSSGSSRGTNNSNPIAPLLLNHQKPPRVRTRNRFHSHPSPTPQIRLSTSRRGTTNTTHHWSQKWRFFHMGAVQTPDIKFADLRIRSNTGKNFGSRNSNSSTGTSNSGPSEKVRMKKSYWGLFDDCKCTVDAIDQTIGRQLVRGKNSSSNSCFKYDTIGKGESKEEGVKLLRKKKNEKGKQRMSRDRTFEWIKQLSDVDGNGDGGPPHIV